MKEVTAQQAAELASQGRITKAEIIKILNEDKQGQQPKAMTVRDIDKLVGLTRELVNLQNATSKRYEERLREQGRLLEDLVGEIRRIQISQPAAKRGSYTFDIQRDQLGLIQNVTAIPLER